MRLVQYLTGVFLLLMSFSLHAQSDFETYMRSGIEQHDKGNYSQAIKLYKKAIKLQPKSNVAHYELALSYFHNKDYKKAIKEADIILNNKEDFYMRACVIKGSALDMMGKTGESISLFKTAIDNTNGHPLLYYNLAVNYIRVNDWKKAEDACFSAISMDRSYASAHLLLGKIQGYNKKRIPAILSFTFFLTLEPTSARAEEAYNFLMKELKGNVNVKDSGHDNVNHIEIQLDADGDSNAAFSAAELMISMMDATSMSGEAEKVTAEEMYIKKMRSVVDILAKDMEKNEGDIWWDLYIPFFAEIQNAGHLETFCYFIAQAHNPKAKEWLDSHEKEFEAFATWVKGEDDK